MISHDHKFIFTHVPKTAGKSFRSLFGLPEFERDYKPDGRDIEHGFGHKRLCEFEKQEYFSKYFKFAFVRNPFDRIVSAYFYLENGGCNETDEQFRKQYLSPYKGCFAAFVEDLPKLVAAPHFKPQADWLCDGRSNLLTDFIGRYESLQRDAADIGRRLGLSFRDVPIINSSRHAPYQSYYDDETKRRVANVYEKDIDLFFYRF